MEQRILRTQLWDVLQYGRGGAGRLFTIALILLIVVSISVLPLEFVAALEEFTSLLLGIEVVLTVIFTVEYGLRIFSAPNRMKYVFSFFGIVDLISIVPFYLGFLGTQYIRALRLVRLVRLLKVSRIEAAAVSGRQDQIRDEVGLLDEEHIEHVVTRHSLFFLFGLVPTLITTSAGLLMLLAFSPNAISVSLSTSLFVFAAIFLWKAWLDYRYDVIYVTNKRLIFQNWHLLGRNTNQVSFQAIMNVKPRHTGIISYLLGFGSIVIETAAAEEGSIEHKLIRSHEHSARIIMQKSIGARRSV